MKKWCSFSCGIFRNESCLTGNSIVALNHLKVCIIAYMNLDAVIEFKVRSLDPSKTADEIVAEILELTGPLGSKVATRYKGAKVDLHRAEGVPFLPELQHILLNIDWDVIRKGAEYAISSFAVGEFLKMVKGKVRNAQVETVDEGVTKTPPKKISAGQSKPPAVKPKKAAPKKATPKKATPKKATAKKATKKKRS
jgi:hypothetical protein